jgi:UPF0176 protein
MLEIISFYKFTKIQNASSEVIELKEYFAKNFSTIKGTILIAEEGINATICGKIEEIGKAFDYIKNNFALEDCNLKRDLSDVQVFGKLKILLKKEIITIKDKNANPIENRTGKYLTPLEWHEVLKNSDENLILIDTRNKYETSHGIFKNAIDPGIDNFSDFTKYIDNNIENMKNKKVAMYCTGGIRCEKATAYAINKGIKDVYHLKGGILNYIKEFKSNNSQESLWQGECFVFDDRITYK